MTPAVSGTVGTDAKVQYLCSIFHGEVLCQFEFLSTGMEGTNPLAVEYIVLGY